MPRMIQPEPSRRVLPAPAASTSPAVRRLFRGRSARRPPQPPHRQNAVNACRHLDDVPHAAEIGERGEQRHLLPPAPERPPSAPPDPSAFHDRMPRNRRPAEARLRGRPRAARRGAAGSSEVARAAEETADPSSPPAEERPSASSPRRGGKPLGARRPSAAERGARRPAPPPAPCGPDAGQTMAADEAGLFRRRGPRPRDFCFPRRRPRGRLLVVGASFVTMGPQPPGPDLYRELAAGRGRPLQRDKGPIRTGRRSAAASSPPGRGCCRRVRSCRCGRRPRR